MRIAVLGATGNAGQLITQEAVKRGHEVTAIIRQQHQDTAAQHTLIKDVAALTAADLADFDVVVSALSADHIVEYTKHLSQLLADTNTRFVAMGGTGTLYVDPERTLKLFNTPDFPAEFLSQAKPHAEASAYLHGVTDVKWTIISPAADFQLDAPARHDYKFAGDEFTVGANGASEISYADYASALLDEVEDTSGAHVGKQISVRNR